MQSHIEIPEILSPPADMNKARKVHEQKQEDLQKTAQDREGENHRRTAAKMTKLDNNF